MLGIRVVVLLVCSASSHVHAAGSGRLRRANVCLPQTIEALCVSRKENGFKILLPAYTKPRQCTGKAVLVVRWAPQGESTRERRFDWPQEEYTVSGLQPWTKVKIEIYLEYKSHLQCGDDERTPVVQRQTATLKGRPSSPKNFRKAETGKEHLCLAWDPPEITNGPIDGYTYTVCKGHRHCNSTEFQERRLCRPFTDIFNSTLLSLRDLEPLMYYEYTLTAFNQNGDVHNPQKGERVYGATVNLCVRFPPTYIKPLENVHVKCQNQPNSISVSWDLPRAEDSRLYVVEVVGRKDGRSNIRVTKMAKKSDACDGSSCKVTVYGLKAEYVYDAFVRPYIDDVGPFGEGYVVDKCTLPPSAPPPAVKELVKLESTVLSKSEAEFAFWKDMYDNRNGEITSYDIIVAEDKEIEKCDHPIGWKEAHSVSPIPCYFATPESWTPFANGSSSEGSMVCSSNATYARCVLGSDTECGEKDYCNGPLRKGINYAIRIRAHTEGGCTDSAPLYLTAENTTVKYSAGERMSSGVGIVVITGIIPLAIAKVLLGGHFPRIQRS